MTARLRIHSLVLGIATIAAATNIDALTLGRVRGAVIFGQPLNLSVPIVTDPGQDGRSLCVAATVFNGDTRVDSARISVTMDSADASGNALVRIRSAPVDEPFVTVELSVGCGQGVLRRYVMLADVLADPVPEAQAPAGPSAVGEVVAPALATAPPLASQPVAPGGAGSGAASGASATTSTVATPRPAPRTAPTQQPSKASTGASARARGDTQRQAAKPVAGSAQAKLRLDPVPPRAATGGGALRRTTELSSSPSASASAAAEAAAAWRALNRSPQDLGRDAQQLQAMDAELKTLRDLAAKNQAVLAELNTRLQRAESDARMGTMAYVFGALFALTLLIVVALVLRLRNKGRQASAWWEDREQVAKADIRLRMMAGAQADSPARDSPSSVSPDIPVDVPVVLQVKKEGATSSPKAPHSEELFDVQQQAEFFVSLGQVDQAIALLNNHIRSDEETGPTAYLDLLRIYSATGRKQEYEELRASFMRVFNANVPAMAGFGDDSRPLVDYSESMERIQSVWGSSRAVKVLEEMIFRRPGAKWEHAFELAAYRDLLTLLAVAKEIAATAAHSGTSSERIGMSGFGGLPLGARGGDRAPTAAGAEKHAASGGLDLDLAGTEPAAVGDITAYERKPESDISSAPTRPATLEELSIMPRAQAPTGPRPADQSDSPPAAPALQPAAELPGNLLEFDMVLPPSKPPAPDTKA